jgi:hypothetical protein
MRIGSNKTTTSHKTIINQEEDMSKKTRTRTLPRNSESIDLKPWQAPVVEEMAIDQTEETAGSSGDDGILYTS